PAHDLGLERRSVDQRLVQECRAKIGEDAEPRAQNEQAGFGFELRRVVVVLRRADSAEQHGVARQAGLQRGVGQWRPLFLQRLPAYQSLVEFKFVTEFLCDRLKAGDGLARYFNADPIAWKDCDFELTHRKYLYRFANRCTDESKIQHKGSKDQRGAGDSFPAIL